MLLLLTAEIPVLESPSLSLLRFIMLFYFGIFFVLTGQVTLGLSCIVLHYMFSDDKKK